MIFQTNIPIIRILNYLAIYFLKIQFIRNWNACTKYNMNINDSFEVSKGTMRHLAVNRSIKLERLNQPLTLTTCDSTSLAQCRGAIASLSYTLTTIALFCILILKRKINLLLRLNN